MEQGPTTLLPPDESALQRILHAEAQYLRDQAPRSYRVSFFRQKWILSVLPLATSLALHATLIVIGLALFKAIPKITEVVREQIIIPEATLADNGPPGGIPHPGLGGDPTRDAAQDLNKDVPQDSAGWSAKASNQLNQALLGDPASADSNTITLGPGVSLGGKGADIGGVGGEGAGQLAPFGVPGGGNGAGPKSTFLGTGGNARKILYLCDASGSMLSVFGNLKFELKKSIDALKPIQTFNVIFFSDDKVYPLDPDSLITASPENKRRAYDFIDNATSAGGTQPLPAIHLAMSQQPELMYVLTDGFDQIANFNDVILAFRQGNSDHKMKINCIFLQSAEDPKLVEVLKQIAKENGGLMKTILKTDF
jgi:hypothetical protein